MSSDPEHTWGHTIAFGEEYYQNAVAMLREICDEAAIVEVASRAATALGTGHRVYANAAVGHMPPYELDNEREGNPALFEFTGGAFTPDQFEAMQEGDVLITSHINTAVREARDRGVYVAVVTTPYLPHRKTPPGQVRPNENDWMPEDVASLVIDSRIPWEQGLVHVPEIPEMAVFPGSSVGTCAIHWMITGEVAHALETGTPPDGRVGRQYIDTLLERLADFHGRDMARADQVAEKIARRIIGGGRYFVRSRNKGVELDAYTVAQGLMLCNTLEQRAAAEGGDQDTLLVAAVTPDDPQELEWADQARASGNYLIGIGPTNSDGLRQRCDEYFDDGCDEKPGVIAIPGREEPVCPATGILNLIIMYVLTAQFVDEMCRRGAVPYFWMGVHRACGGDYNKVLEPFFRARGY